MNTVRVGLVGAGFAASYHVEWLRRVYGLEVQLAGVTSLRAESRSRFAEKHGIKAFENLKSMLPEVDLIDMWSAPYA